MFCNGSRMDEGDLARPRAATITGMMSPEVLFVPAHDCGQHRQLIWAHHYTLLKDIVVIQNFIIINVTRVR